MLNNDLNSVTLNDIVNLKNAGIEEGLNFEYKRELNFGKKENKEFAADVVSFANSQGGHLIFGVTESEGSINEIIGMQIKNVDTYKAQIENILRDLIKPNIIGLRIKVHHINEDRYVLHIYIPKSFSSPHMAKDQFFGRNYAGKAPLDHNQIRHKFLLQSGIQQLITEYRNTRLDLVKNGLGYFPSSGATLLLNIIPFSSMTGDVNYINLGKPSINFEPITSYGYDPYVNFEGIGCKFETTDADLHHLSYHHMTHFGITELVDTSIFHSSKKRIYAKQMKNELLKSIEKAKRNYQKYNINDQYALCFSILNVEHYSVAHDEKTIWGSINKNNISDLIFPILTFNLDSNTEEILEPIYNLISNAAGVTAN